MEDAENIKMSTTSATPTTKTTAGTTAHLTARFVKSDQQSKVNEITAILEGFFFTHDYDLEIVKKISLK